MFTMLLKNRLRPSPFPITSPTKYLPRSFPSPSPITSPTKYHASIFPSSSPITSFTKYPASSFPSPSPITSLTKYPPIMIDRLKIEVSTYTLLKILNFIPAVWRFFYGRRGPPNENRGAWTPVIRHEFVGDDHLYEIHMPGVSPRNVTLKMEGRKIMISAHRMGATWLTDSIVTYAGSFTLHKDVNVDVFYLRMNTGVLKIFTGDPRECGKEDEGEDDFELGDFPGKPF